MNGWMDEWIIYLIMKLTKCLELEMVTWWIQSLGFNEKKKVLEANNSPNK